MNMIKTKSVKAVIMAITILSLVATMYGKTVLALKENRYISENKFALVENVAEIKPVKALEKEKPKATEKALDITVKPIVAEAKSEEDLKKEALEAKMNEIVFEDLTLRELSDKLERSLNDTLQGQGYTFASLATELGINPYLAVAIVLHETGCKWQCSSLLKKCNNVGGMKGEGCEGSSYAGFATLEEGISRYMHNLYDNYVSKGLTTAEAIGPKYAASTTWSTQVNTYMNEIKAA